MAGTRAAPGAQEDPDHQTRREESIPLTELAQKRSGRDLVVRSRRDSGAGPLARLMQARERTERVEHPTSNIEQPTSNGGEDRKDGKNGNQGTKGSNGKQPAASDLEPPPPPHVKL